jgi:4-hydroxybenzoate polyprenyltransferase
MRRIVRRVLAAVEVSRLPVAFGAVANVWLAILLVRHDAELADAATSTLPLWEALTAGALVAVGFLAFGAALNDFLDAKHDRAFAPERPLPAGNLRPHRAAQLAAVALCVGFLGTVPFGSAAMICAIALAAAILVYDAFAKHVPALGIVLAGLATALSMSVPCIETRALLPIWLAMSQTMGLGALAYVLGEKRPKLTRGSIAIGAAGWVFWTTVLFALATERNQGALLPQWPDARLLAAPAITVLLCAAFGAWKLRRLRGPAVSDKLLRYGSLWKSLVAAAWLLAAGLPFEAAWIAGIATAIFVTVAILRETGPQLSEPVSWRS